MDLFGICNGECCECERNICPFGETDESKPIPYNPAHRGAVTAEQFEAIWNDESEVQE